MKNIKNKILKVLDENYNINLFSTVNREQLAVLIEKELSDTDNSKYKDDEIVTPSKPIPNSKKSNKKPVKKVQPKVDNTRRKKALNKLGKK